MSGIDLALLVVAASFVMGLLRVALGPTLADRALAVDLCLFCVIAALALLSVRLSAPTFVDVVLVTTVVGFVATVSLARLIRREEDR